MIDYRTIFLQDPFSYLRVYCVNTFSKFLKSVEILPSYTNDCTDVNLYYTRDEKVYLIITNDMYKEIVEMYAEKFHHDSRPVQTLREKLAEEREARRIVNEEFNLLAHPRILIKVLPKLKELKFEPDSLFKYGYEMISKLHNHGEFFYAPKSKEIWSSNKRFDNVTVKRMGHLYTFGDYYSRRNFDTAFKELLNEYIEAMGLEPDYNYSNFFKKDYYCITYEDISAYCKLFSHTKLGELEYENLY